MHNVQRLSSYFYHRDLYSQDFGTNISTVADGRNGLKYKYKKYIREAEFDKSLVSYDRLRCGLRALL